MIEREVSSARMHPWTNSKRTNWPIRTHTAFNLCHNVIYAAFPTRAVTDDKVLPFIYDIRDWLNFLVYRRSRLTTIHN